MAMTTKHPNHSCMLAASYLQFPYVCNGCHEKGAGLRYRCHTCNFNLHQCCALNTDTTPLRMHSLHNEDGHFLQFLTDPNPFRRNFSSPCNACGKPVHGFAYHCVYDSCGYVLHPCCGLLPATIKLPSVEFLSQREMEIVLFLCTNLRGHCGYCGRSSPSWAYVSSSLDYSIHIGCVREMFIEATSRPQPPPDPHSISRTASPAAQHLPLQRVQVPSRNSRLFFKITEVISKGIVGVLFGALISLI